MNLYNRSRLYFLKNEIVVVGIAPYSRLLNKNAKYFKRNTSFYFTSWDAWDGSKFPNEGIDNIEEFERHLKECFLGAFCVSKKSAEQLRNVLDADISIVNHAVNCELYRKREDSNLKCNKYIFVGQYIKRKNIDLILSWLERNKDCDLEVAFVGRGPLEREIDLSSERDHRIKNLGFCSKGKLQAILCEYDFLILPSESEPFGIVLIEALAAGTPCIASSTTGGTEIIHDGINGFIFDLNDAESAFDLAMKKSMSMSAEQLATMRYNSAKNALEYDSGQIIDKWMDLIKKCF
ncbi:MAG: glycosyltransferase family 4 protein [Clostridiales bacterium]|nr:glycosyltransferase family 4 protein [Clostridiales bacterium]